MSEVVESEPMAEPAADEVMAGPDDVVAGPDDVSAGATAAPTPEPATVAAFVADRLRRAGVRWAFTVPGESFLPLMEAFEAVGIHVVATRHEGAAAHMAEAHAQLTGRPAVAMGTRAVGAANLAIGIHTAMADSTPMFAIVGGVETGAQGREAFQEVDLATTIGGLAKWAAAPLDAAAAAGAVDEAVVPALGGRPGPVLLAIPEDL